MNTQPINKMLKIPLKISRETDISKFLSKWIEKKSTKDIDDDLSQRSDESWSSFQSGIIRITSLRRAILKGIQSRDGWERAIEGDVLKDGMEYHALLLELEERGFGMGEDKKDEKLAMKCGFEVVWECAFDRHAKIIKRYNLKFERACILWNIASLECYSGCSQDMTTRSGLGNAVKRFNYAAGIFLQLKKEVVVDPNLTLDLTPNSLDFCGKVCLAQAQSCVYEMALLHKDPMQSVLAKLAMAAANLYNDALFFLQTNPQLKSAARFAKESHFKTFGMFFKARAEYHYALYTLQLFENPSANATATFGHYIARLNNTESIIEQALLFADGAWGSKPIESLKLSILERKYRAMDMNEKIHHSIIPPVKDLTPISSQQLSKPLGLQKSLLPSSLPQPSLFSDLIPPQARKILQKFNSQTSQSLQNLEETCNQKTDAVRQSLAAVNLPQSLTAYTARLSGQGLPQDIWHKIEIHQNSHTLETLKLQLEDLKAVSEKSRNIVNTLGKRLDDDLVEHDEFMQSYPSFPTKNLYSMQKPLRDNLKKCQNFLENAVAGDKKLLSMRDKLNTEKMFLYLGYNKPQLDELIAFPSSGEEPPQPVNIEKLTTLLRQLTQLLKQRETSLQELTFKINSPSLKTQLFKAPANTHEMLYENALTEVLMLEKQIHENLGEQPLLLEGIMTENSVFIQARNKFHEEKQNAAESQEILCQIEEGLISLSTLSKQAAEGKGFYDNILPILQQLEEHSEKLGNRLEIEKCRFLDDDKRRQQEEEDRKVAETLLQEERRKDAAHARVASGSGAVVSPPASNPSITSITTTTTTTPYTPPPMPSSTQPPSTFQPPPPFPTPPPLQSLPKTEVKVDDAKMAKLLEFGFEPEKIEQALRKFGNDEDRALNELLSS